MLDQFEVAISVPEEDVMERREVKRWTACNV